MFTRHWQQEALHDLDEPYDLIIVGGGITGCGVFFDAAQRGLRVLLVEKGDLASGTSSRSSKLLHGGLRYLKNFQLRVTRSSCYERDLQLRLNPHLVTAIPWLHPTYIGRRPSGREMELGLWVYDRLTQRPEKHRRVAEEEALQWAPGLERRGLDRALVYFDARVDDARLTRAVAASGFACGGRLLTYTKVEDGHRDADGRLDGLVLRDLRNGRSRRVFAHLVINATGAWVDGLRHLLGLDGRTVRPSRGSHLIFDRQRLPVKSALTFISEPDRRPVFVIPHPEGTLVGTTDLFHNESVDDVRATRAEVDYLMRVVTAAFTDHPPTHDDIRGVFSGVRPVLDNQADHPSKASREEAVWHERGLLSVAGGKLTTWRKTAEEVVDEALDLLPTERQRLAAPCATAGTPLANLAGIDLHRRLERAYGAAPPVAEAMARRLGSLAWIAGQDADAEQLLPIREDIDLCPAELRAHLRFGAVTHLSDLLLRRVRVGMWNPAQARDLAADLAEISAPEMGWSVDRELERFHHELAAWTLDGVVDDGNGTELAATEQPP